MLMRLYRLRTLACLGIAAALLIAHYLHLEFQTYSAVVFATLVMSNIGLAFTHHKIQAKHYDLLAAIILIFDSLVLSLLLKFNGGSQNPFSILFLSLASVAAMLLPKKHLIINVVVMLLGLFLVYADIIPGLSHLGMQHHHDYPFHLQGMYVANSIALICIAIFTYRLRMQVEQSQKILHQIEKIESMGRVVAAAAHQLNTPLGTLQLGISELSENTLDANTRKDWYADMQHAVTQMQKIITQIKPSNNPLDEHTSTIDLAAAVMQIVNLWAKPRKRDIKFALDSISFNANATMIEDLTNLLTALLDNAHDAMANKIDAICVSLNLSGTYCLLQVKDTGVGMDTATCARALEPLFTNKTGGTGLGLYLCSQLAQKYGGYIDLVSAPGQGSSVNVYLNLSRL